ncbi:MAG: hypothetical protein JWL65_7300 [Gammaproteobacteria bacterium]|nr:hypothetical protein [Gammaproteobacteria bacterium]
MVMDQTTTTHRSAHSKERLSGNEVIASRRVKYAMDFVAPAPKQPLSEAIEEQRLSVLNVLGIVRCIGMGVANGEKEPAPEMSMAFELLECEIQRIATAMEKISLRSAMREISTPARLEIRQRTQGHA